MALSPVNNVMFSFIAIPAAYLTRINLGDGSAVWHQQIITSKNVYEVHGIEYTHVIGPYSVIVIIVRLGPSDPL
jgi:hypothetical protein